MSDIKEYIKEYNKQDQWKCNLCGIIHEHNPVNSQHNIKNEIESDLNYNPICNCGIHEAYELFIRDELKCSKSLEKRIKNLAKYKQIPKDVKSDIWFSVSKRIN